MTTAWKFSLPETIASERMTLRPPRSNDARAVAQAVAESFASIDRWMGWASEDYDAEQARTWIEAAIGLRASGEAFEYLAHDRRGQLLGGLVVSRIHPIHRFANLGYWIRTSMQGRGLATEAARRLAEASLVEGGLERIELVIPERHLESRRVAERLGATYEGVQRRRMWLRDEAHDAAMYSLVQSDLAKR